MNNLSWLIYMMQIADELRSFVAATAVAIIVFGGVAGVISAMAKFIEDEEWPLKLWLKQLRWAIPVLAFCGVVSTFVPSRQTIILIAGSEIGERALQSDAASDGMKLVKLWIKQETDKLAAGASTK